MLLQRAIAFVPAVVVAAVVVAATTAVNPVYDITTVAVVFAAGTSSVFSCSLSLFVCLFVYLFVFYPVGVFVVVLLFGCCSDV